MGVFMKKSFFICSILLVASCAFAKVGDSRYVAVQGAEVRVKASSFAKSTGSLKYAEEVEIVSENNGWTEVMSKENPKVKGWISSSALSKRKIVSSSFSASANELALAGKGFSDSIEGEYKKNSNTNYAAVDAMEKQSVKASDVRKFMVDGMLNTGDTGTTK